MGYGKRKRYAGKHRNRKSKGYGYLRIPRGGYKL